VKKKGVNFLEQIVDGDIKRGYNQKTLRFRFPPEPNGHLHVGHLKAICVNFNLGEKYGAPVNLRFDDTNPEKEAKEYVDAIKNDIEWLGFKWDKECYASDYFQQLYEWAHELIDKGHAYVDSQTSEQIAFQKGAPTEPGKNSPNRARSTKENKRLFEEMYSGKSKAGEHVLRAKIDMASPNMLMRDPIIYRSMSATHHRTGDAWKIYPLYDWTHGESDYIEQVTHSLCTLEFEPHRELYDWFLDALEPLTGIRPKQREFSRLNLSYTITSKRILAELVASEAVQGWDDPRLPTISGLRKRGYTPNALKQFINTAGVSKRENVIDVSLLEFCIRADLNENAPRARAVMSPLKITIKNYPENKREELDFEINPQKKELGKRKVFFERELYIEREDFQEKDDENFYRLTKGQEVRLKNAYIIKAEEVIKNSDNTIEEVVCSYDPKSKSGSGTEESSRKVKATIHWLGRKDAVAAKVNVYDRLFKVPEPGKENKIKEDLNENSLKTLDAFIEPYLKEAEAGSSFQFQRLGYFIKEDGTNQPVFNKTIGLRDSWKKESK
jgi:glutaminyl-tRNA synthetase